MSAVVVSRDPQVLLAAAREAVAALQGVDWAGCSDDLLLDGFRELEVLRRQLPAVEHGLILEAQSRGLPERLAQRSVGGMLRALLRIDPREAAGRVRAAEAAGPRRAVTGEPLPPVFPVVAAAQAGGVIGPRHAALIVKTIERLPDTVRAERGGELEAELVAHAGRFDPDQLGKLCQRLLYCYDQDGPPPCDPDPNGDGDGDGGDGPADDGPGEGELTRRFRHRFLRLTQRPDGSAHGEFEATAELAELLLTQLDALAVPHPAADGVTDRRTGGQRNHDALLEALRLVVRARLLPAVKGVTATLIVTMSKRAYETGRGLARTGHGAIVPAREALRWGRYGGDLRLLAAVLSKVKPVEAYSTTMRFHTEKHRLLAGMLHGGCTFPHCGVGPAGCQLHHVIDHAQGGETSINLAAPVCAKDHHQRIAEGWQATVINNRIAWIPPVWLDHRQTPQYNELHLPGLTLHDDDDENEGGDEER